MTINHTSIDQQTFKRLRRLSIIALAAIALSVSVNHILIGKFLNKQEGDSQLINRSGRQRMLSQKLVKESLLLVRENHPEVRKTIKNNLEETLNLWATSHNKLQKNREQLDLPATKNNIISEMFQELSPYYNSMFFASNSLIAKIEANPSIANTELTGDIEIIEQNGANYLSVMNDIVDQYDIAAHKKVNNLQNLLLFLTICTILILLLEFLVVFLPMAKGVKNNIQKLMKAEEKAMKMAHDADVLAEAKEKSVKQLRSLDQTLDHILLFARIAPDGSLLHMGEKFSRFFQFRKFNIESRFSEVLSIHKSEQLAIDHIIAVNKKSGWQGEIKATTKTKKDIWLDMSIAPFSPGEDRTELIVICVDITKNKEAQFKIEQLTEGNFKKKIHQQNVISRKIIENQENEQNRIAKDIHDGIGQMLTGLKYTLESIDLSDKEKAGTKIENLKELTTNILKGVRTATFNLTPPELMDYGIVPALLKLTQELTKLTGKKIIFFNKTGFDQRLDSLIEINLYRIAQEAVNNAIKYAASTHIIVTISHSKEVLSINIDDNGSGFNPENTKKEKNSESGMGMTFMKERIKYINGRLFINSSPGEGTKVTLNIPLKNS